MVDLVQSPDRDAVELVRLDGLRAQQILDTPREAALDRITALAAALFDAPVGLVTLVDEDRIWFKSHHGLDVEQITRESGLCSSAIMQDEVWVVEDALTDERTCSNSLVTGPMGLRFYAGAPLRTASGNLGTLSVIDVEPRTFDESQQRVLTELAAIVVDILDMRLSAIELLRASDLGADVSAAELQAEVTRRRRAEQSQRLLAHVTGILLGTDSIELALEEVIRLMLPTLGVAAGIGIIDERGFRTSHAAHIDPAAAPLMGQVRDASHAVTLDRTPPIVEHVVTTGAPLVVTATEALRWPGMPPSPELEQLIEELGAAWFLIVPLRARGHTLGTLSFVTTDISRRYSGQDIRLASDLAERIAVAIDNAQLHQTEREIASALQSSLLPPVLPQIPGVDVAAEYRAAGPADIGGDFYDLYSNDGRTWHMLLGDVSGKGAEAAAIAGLARYTARALALTENTPGAILERLNTAVGRQSQDGKFLTALAGAARRVGDTLEVQLADAGHPPPLVRRADGSVEEVLLGGTVLGLFPDSAVDTATIVLGPGDLLLLYTDGLIEARTKGGHFLGLTGLKEALAGVGATKPANVVTLLLQVVDAVDGGVPGDDVAMLALRVQATADV